MGDIEWDPTGRYVATGVSYWAHKVDNAYWLWNFQGKILKRSNVEKFCQLVWRPRPPSLLSKEQQKDVRKNLKKYTDQFNAKTRCVRTRPARNWLTSDVHWLMPSMTGDGMLLLRMKRKGRSVLL